MTQWHDRIPKLARWRACGTAQPPNTLHNLATARSAQNHAMNWRFGSQLFAYSAPRTTTSPTAPTSGTFHVALPGAERLSGEDRKLLIAWRGLTYTGGVAHVDYMSSYNAPTPATIWERGIELDSTLTFIGGAGGKDDPTQIQYLTFGFEDVQAVDRDVTGSEIVWTPSASGSFTALRIDYEHVFISALSVWEYPRDVLNQIDAVTAAERFQPGRHIRGYDGVYRTDLGSLAWSVGRGRNAEDRIEAATRRALISWGHPVGVYTASSSPVDLFGGTMTFKVRTRTLRDGGNTIRCRPWAVVTTTAAHSGAAITLTNNTDSTSATWTNGATARTAALIEFGDLLDVDDDGYKEITIEANAASGGELLVHSVGLFEGRAWGV